MSKIKFPQVREIISEYSNLIKEYNTIAYLDYCDIHNKPTPTLITNDDGLILDVADKNGITARQHWDNLQKRCSDIANDHNELTFTDYDYLADVRRLANGRRQKQYRCNEKVKYLLQFPCNFLTLTFKPSVRSSTSEKTRRRYVIDFLNSLNCSYFGNIDFHKDGFDHYHVLVATINIDYSKWHKYGGCKGKVVHIDKTKPENLTRYICKLSNHSIKASTKGHRIISKMIKDV